MVKSLYGYLWILCLLTLWYSQTVMEEMQLFNGSLTPQQFFNFCLSFPVFIVLLQIALFSEYLLQTGQIIKTK